MGKLRELLSGHKHYWSAARRDEDNKVIQTCYECGAKRQVTAEIL
jgi:hypothetical protein